MIGKKIEFKNGWIFSPTIDLAFFLGLIAFTVGAFKLSEGQGYNLDNIIGWYLFHECFAMLGHVSASTYPAILAMKSGKMNKNYFLLAVIFIASINFSLAHYSNTLFHVFFITTSLFHFSKQDIGWIRLSERKRGRRASYLDDIMIYNIVFMPILIYLSDDSKLPKTAFVKGDFNWATLPGELSEPFSILYYSYTCFYLLYQGLDIYRTRQINLAKFVIIISTSICFWHGTEQTPLWIARFFVHAVPYITHTYYHSKRKTAKPLLFLNNIFVYFAAVTIMGGILMIDDKYGSLFDNYSHLVAPFIHTIVTTHIWIDSIIWRRNAVHQS